MTQTQPLMKWGGSMLGWMPADSEYFTGVPEEELLAIRARIAKELDMRRQQKTSEPWKRNGNIRYRTTPSGHVSFVNDAGQRATVRLIKSGARRYQVDFRTNDATEYGGRFETKVDATSFVVKMLR